MAELTEKQIEDIVRAAETILGGARVQEYHEILQAKVAGEASPTWDCSRVDSRRLRVITHIAALNATTSSTFIRLAHINGGQTAIDKVGVAPLIGESVNWDGFMILGEGDFIRIYWLGCGTTDALWAVVSGYEILK